MPFVEQLIESGLLFAALTEFFGTDNPRKMTRLIMNGPSYRKALALAAIHAANPTKDFRPDDSCRPGVIYKNLAAMKRHEIPVATCT